MTWKSYEFKYHCCLYLSFIGMLPYPFTYILSVATFMLYQQSWVVLTEIYDPQKLKFLLLGPLKKRFINLRYYWPEKSSVFWQCNFKCCTIKNAIRGFSIWLPIYKIDRNKRCYISKSKSKYMWKRNKNITVVYDFVVWLQGIRIKIYPRIIR